MSRLLAFSLLLIVSAAMFVGCEKAAETTKTTTPPVTADADKDKDADK